MAPLVKAHTSLGFQSWGQGWVVSGAADVRVPLSCSVLQIFRSALHGSLPLPEENRVDWEFGCCAFGVTSDTV